MSILARILPHRDAPAAADAAALTHAERAEHVASLRAVPWQFFHRTEPRIAETVRADLIARAEAGEEVYAYPTTPSGRWLIWIQTDDAAVEMRHDPLDVTCHYLATHGYHGALSDLEVRA